jgi:hypothetical protein
MESSLRKAYIMKKNIQHLLVFLMPIIISFFSFNTACQNKCYVRKSSIWPNSEIPVCWENPDPSNLSNRELVKNAITGSWERYSTLRFIGWGQCRTSSKGIRIRISDTCPCTLGLGTKINGVPGGMTLNFTYNNWCNSCLNQVDFYTKAFAIHEFGHAIGLSHEHNLDSCRKNCMQEKQGDEGDWEIGNCDDSSIMNYCNPNWNNNGELSRLDIEGVRVLYDYKRVLYDYKKVLYGYKTKVDDGFLSKNTFELWYYVRKDSLVMSNERKKLWRIKCYLEGEAKDMSKVKEVEYILPETFSPSEIYTSSLADRFGVSIETQDEITLKVIIAMNNNVTYQFNKYLSIHK